MSERTWDGLRAMRFCGIDGINSVVLAEDDWVFSATAVITAANRVRAAGGEGCMLKDAEAGYVRNQNSAWLKVTRKNEKK